MANWSIEYRQFAIPVPSPDIPFFTHGMLIFRNGNGQDVHVFEGLAADSNGNVKAIGLLPTDKIVFRDYGKDWDYRYNNQVGQTQVLFEGSQSEVEKLATLAAKIGNAINAKNLGYPPVGIFGVLSKNVLEGIFDITNSNSVISTLIKALGIKTEYPDLLSPGTDVLLLKPAEWNAIRAQMGLGAISSADEIFFGSDNNMVKWSSYYDDETLEHKLVAARDGTSSFYTELDGDGSKITSFFDDVGDAIGTLFKNNTGALTKAQFNAKNVAASEIGELFGSMLGRTVASGNPVAEIAAGTLLGLTMSKVGSVLEAGFSGDLPTLIGDATKSSTAELGGKLGGILSNDILTRLQGVRSSMLAAELAEALGITGFEGQVFTAVTNGVTSEFIKTTISLVRDGTFTTEKLFNTVLNSTDMISGIHGSLGGLAGSQLASFFITPDSPEAQIFASVGSSIGAIVGAAGGAALGWIPFIGPFAGSFLGTLIGTWAGNAFSDNDERAFAELGISQETSKLGILREWSLDGGNMDISGSMADAVVGTVNNLLDETGLRLDDYKPFTLQVWYYNNTDDLLVAAAGTFSSPNPADLMVEKFYTDKHGNRYDGVLSQVAQTAINQTIDAMSVVGGDAVMRRAFYASRDATGSIDDGLTRLGFDLQIAKDYRFFLDHEELIKATMAAQKDSAYTAGWTATLARVNELGLNRGSVNDFKGGFYANLKVNEVVQGPRGMAGGLAPERLAWVPDLDARDIAAKSMKTGDLILTSADGLSSVRADDVFGPGAVVTLTGGNSTATVDGSTINKPDASVILVKAGDGAKTVKGSASQGSIIVGGEGAQVLIGGNGNDWLRGGKDNRELLGGNGDDLLVAGGGSTAVILDGGTGRNTYYLGPNDATVRISALDSKGSDTIIATLAGALSDRNAITVDARGNVSGLNVTKNSNFSRSGADLVIATTTGDSRDGAGKITVENFFLRLNSIDTIAFSDGTLSNMEIWNRAGVNTLISVDTWNTADGTPEKIFIDTANTQGNIFAAASTRTSDGTSSLFDVGIYDDGSMHTVAYDPGGEHDWAKWLTEYTGTGDIKGETITLDAEYADGSNIIVTRGSGGVVAGSVGDDVLRSAVAGSTLIGDRGNDDLSGSGGSDLLYGGSGDDHYTVGVGDRLFEFTGQGFDVVEATASYTLAAGQEIEELRLANPTGTAAFNLTGNERNDTLVGNAGANVLNGGAGSDVMRGGGGNDVYVVDVAGDKVEEGAGEGTDEVRTALSSYTLGAELETLRYTGASAFSGTGNGLDNTLWGGAGNDTLDGGYGDDVLRGQGGNDTYRVDNINDRVIEAADGGRDTVVTVNSFTLQAGQEIEVVKMADLAGTTARNLTGNEFANTLIGNAGTNILRGGAGNDALDGGNGDDVLYGEEGNDTYQVDNVNDQVFEAAGEGRDTIITVNSFTLQAGQEIEVVQMADLAGTATRSLLGNEFGNTLIGNAGENSLYGRDGNDILDGGAGADRIDGGEGIDTVSFGTASRGVSINLADGGTWEGGAGDTLVSIESAIGSDFDDTIKGSAGNNRIYGDGGNDLLTGNGGSDTFVFRSALGTTNVDRIADFASGDDQIILDDGIMPALAKGTLSVGAFKNISQASADADDRILYKQATGELFYDADGSGSGAAVRFAVLENKASLVYQDFLVA